MLKVTVQTPKKSLKQTVTETAKKAVKDQQKNKSGKK